MEWLSLMANIMQVISFVPLAVGAVYFFARSRQLDRRLKALAAKTSSRPLALAVGLGGDIEGAVRQHLKDSGLHMEVLSVTRPGLVPPTEFPAILREVNEHKERLNEIGVTEVNVYYRGPVTFAVALGAALGNWVPAKIYDFREGQYVLALVLTKEAVIEPK